MIDMTKGFTLVRTFEASPEQVWEAWLDPECIAAWWHPQGAKTPRDSVEVDRRIGGRYRYAMVNDADGTTVVTGGVYREMTPHSRLAFTWGEPDADPDETPIITITLEAHDRGTRMTFDLRGVEGAPGDSFFYDGWASTLESLADFLDGSRAH